MPNTSVFPSDASKIKVFPPQPDIRLVGRGFSRLQFPLLVGCVFFVFAFRSLAQVEYAELAVTELKRLTVEELMDVEVTSVTKQPEPYRQAPAAIQVVTGNDIRRAGASSIPEALRLADNLQVAQKNSHDWGISARGFNTELANKLLVLMDGRTVYSPLFSGVFWDVQDYLLEDINRIEVISGPGGTLWGANAVNGVINITSKSAKDTQGVYVEGGGGSSLQGFGGVRYGGTLASNVYFRVYGKYFDRNNEVYANGNGARDAWHKGQGGFRIDAEPSPENLLTLQGDLYYGESELPIGDSTVSGGNILGRWTHIFSEDSQARLQLYYDRTHLVNPTANIFGAGILKDDLDTYDLDFQHNFRLLERHRIVWGLGYRFTHDVVDQAAVLAFVPPTLDRHLFSGFVQDEIMLLDNLFFTLGSKVEHNDYTGIEYEPSARLRWNMTERNMLWGAVSRAVRMPSRVDRDLRQPTPSAVFFQGGADYQSETVIAYELGYRGQIGSRVSVSLSTFYNEYDRVRSLNTTPITVFPLFFDNDLEGETYGFELVFDYHMLDWWRWHVGYTLLEADIRVKSGEFDFNNALNETADPEHQVSVRSSIDLLHNLEFDTALRWVDTLHNNNGPTVGTVPDYFELTVRLGWRPTPNLELSVVGQNLLHDHHPEFGFPGPTRGEIQRSVYGKVSWQF